MKIRLIILYLFILSYLEEVHSKLYNLDLQIVESKNIKKKHQNKNKRKSHHNFHRKIQLNNIWKHRQQFEMLLGVIDNVNIVTNLYVGENMNKYQVLVDTGSQYFWLQNSNCSFCKLVPNGNYNITASKTSKLIPFLDVNYKYMYSVIYGSIVMDQISIDKIHISNDFSFLAVNLIFDQQQDIGAYDGILGLGFNSQNLQNFNLIHNLKKNNFIEKSQFSVYLGDPQKPQLTIGGYQQKHIQQNSQLEYIQISSERQWALQAKECYINNQTIQCNNANVIIDSGSSHIVVSPKLFAQIIQTFDNSGFNTQIGQISKSPIINCQLENQNLIQNLPAIKIKFKDYIYTLEPSYYVKFCLRQLFSNSIICQIGIVESEYIDNQETIILGLPFLLKHLVLFDFEQKQIGLAESFIPVINDNYQQQNLSN